VLLKVCIRKSEVWCFHGDEVVGCGFRIVMPYCPVLHTSPWNVP
jgi:hypothetical protein